MTKGPPPKQADGSARLSRRRHHSWRLALAAVGAAALAVLLVAGGALGLQLAMLQSSMPASSVSRAGHPVPAATLRTVAEFPVGTFLENIAVRADGSMLVTDLREKQLWYLPAPTGDGTVQPLLLHTFDQPPFDITETERDVFYVDAATYSTTHHSHLYRVDLRRWKPGMPVPVRSLLEFPFPISSANGACAPAPNVILVADSLIGLIWRIDLSDDGAKTTARVWLRHASMLPDPFSGKLQPGINGVEYSAKTHFLYYTSTAQRLFMRVRVDPRTLEPVGDPERLAIGHQWDDFELDENAHVAYVTTHRENTIERVPLDPGGRQAVQTVVGKPFDPQLVGPSDFAWGPGGGDPGSVAFVTSDGGYTAPPPDGIVRTAKVLRADLSTP